MIVVALTLEQRVDGLATHTYDYDSLYRITNADYPGADETDYT